MVASEGLSRSRHGKYVCLYTGCVYLLSTEMDGTKQHNNALSLEGWADGRAHFSTGVQGQSHVERLAEIAHIGSNQAHVGQSRGGYALSCQLQRRRLVHITKQQTTSSGVGP